MVKRLAIYAAYDKYGRVDYDDLSYLRALSKVVNQIIYVADNPLRPEEADKLASLCCYVEAYRHGEYDFGSYKRGYQYALRQGMLGDVDELVFCNDSCYAPIFPFDWMFDAMEFKPCDFWGITRNTEFYPHIQSFFLVFRRAVFRSEVFAGFMDNIKKQKSVRDVILHYEVGLSRCLEKNGFKSDCFIDYPADRRRFKKCPNLTAFPIWLIRQGCPVLKKKALRLSSANYEGILKTYINACRYNRCLFEKTQVMPCLCLSMRGLSEVVRRFVFQKKETKSGKLLVKVCKIPVFRRKIRSG